MTNLTRFDNDGIEIFINKDTGESFASIRGAARMADEHQETVRRFLTVTNTQTTNGEIDTEYGKKLVTFLDEDAVLVVLEKYNPSRLKQFAKLGIRIALHQIAGYQISKPLVKYHLTGKITPKARPRLSKGHAYLPSKYRNWKESAIHELRTQSPPLEPTARCEISIVIGGKQTGDLDNIAGSCLDCLTQSGIIKDDRLSVVWRLLIEHQPSQPPGALILIE